MKIINLYGGPGSGKSTIAAGIFYKAKLDDRYRVELFREMAKDYYQCAVKPLALAGR